MGVKVAWAGTIVKMKKMVPSTVENLTDEVIITDDHNLVTDLILKSEPQALFGTQMERHVKRLNIPCGVISIPVHIQNFPLLSPILAMKVQIKLWI